MTKEPADWAKLKAHRVQFPEDRTPAEVILRNWDNFSMAVRELARMYDQYEKRPVDPDLLAARDWLCSLHPSYTHVIGEGRWDAIIEARSFLAGIKHGRVNP